MTIFYLHDGLTDDDNRLTIAWRDNNKPHHNSFTRGRDAVYDVSVSSSVPISGRAEQTMSTENLLVFPESTDNTIPRIIIPLDSLSDNTSGTGNELVSFIIITLPSNGILILRDTKRFPKYVK